VKGCDSLISDSAQEGFKTTLRGGSLVPASGRLAGISGRCQGVRRRCSLKRDAEG
jgi:hypothetical protein